MAVTVYKPSTVSLMRPVLGRFKYGSAGLSRLPYLTDKKVIKPVTDK